MSLVVRHPCRNIATAVQDAPNIYLIGIFEVIHGLLNIAVCSLAANEWLHLEAARRFLVPERSVAK